MYGLICCVLSAVIAKNGFYEVAVVVINSAIFDLFTPLDERDQLCEWVDLWLSYSSLPSAESEIRHATNGGGKRASDAVQVSKFYEFMHK